MRRPALMLAAGFGLVLGAPARADVPVPPMGPSDMRPGGPFTGSLPTSEPATAGAGAVTRNSRSDVTAPVGQPVPLTAVREAAERRRADAHKLAALVRAGQSVPDEYGAKLKIAIEGDLKLWREEFNVRRADFKAAHKRWLDEAGPMSASDWALRRAEMADELAKWAEERR